MKTIVGLIVIVSMVLGTMVGCQTTPSEQVYRDLSVGPMTVSIPDDWQRPGDYAELEEMFFAAFTEEEKQHVQLEGYGDKSEDAVVFIMTMDMFELCELEGWTWRGWDIELEEMVMTAEEFAGTAQWMIMSGFTEVTTETHRQLTIGGCEAWETTSTAKMEGVPAQVCGLTIFAPDDFVVLVMGVKQAEWEKFEEVWEEIRDSIRI